MATSSTRFRIDETRHAQRNQTLPRTEGRRGEKRRRCATRKAQSGPSSSRPCPKRSRGRDAGLLRALVAELHESETGDLIEALDPDLRPQLIELLGTDFDFTALTEVDDTVREEILEELAETVAEGVRELDSDDAVYILETCRRTSRRKSSTSCRRPSASRSSAPSTTRKTPPGGACRPSSSPCRRSGPSGRPSTIMRETEDLPETFYEIFVVDPAGKLLGAVPLDRLLRSKRPVTIPDVMDAGARPGRATEHQEEVARLFERYNLVSAAGGGRGGRLVGVILVDDIVDVLEEEADADIKQLGGVKSGRRALRHGLSHQGPLQLAVRQYVHGVPGRVGAQALRGSS